MRRPYSVDRIFKFCGQIRSKYCKPPFEAFLHRHRAPNAVEFPNRNRGERIEHHNECEGNHKHYGRVDVIENVRLKLENGLLSKSGFDEKSIPEFLATFAWV